MSLQKPLLVLVAGKNPKNKPNLAVQQGHWLVVIGIHRKKKKKRNKRNKKRSNLTILEIFDPASKTIAQIPYHRHCHSQKSWWQNTSYVDPMITNDHQ